MSDDELFWASFWHDVLKTIQVGIVCIAAWQIANLIW